MEHSCSNDEGKMIWGSIGDEKPEHTEGVANESEENQEWCPGSEAGKCF